MYKGFKRFADFVLALLALIILSPLLLILMILIRIDSPGSSVFAQTRIGLHNKPFTVYKLRTMKKTAPKSVAKSELVGAESYITHLGAFLRKSSLDELPQLYNIVRGDMSIIGPRPLVPEEKHVHEERLEKGAYEVRPGLTGWAQVNGRDQVQSGMKAELDAYYAENISFMLDCRIFFRTVSYVLTSHGIQEGAHETKQEESKHAETDHH